MSKLLQFIKEHKNWDELLKAPPYSLFVKPKDKYVLFMYNVYTSDFTNPIVQEARGIIINLTDMKVVCRAFDKFFNYGEPNAHEIDWASAEVQEKVDGSIMKVWWDKKWHVSSQSTVDARDAIFSDGEYDSFYYLFIQAFQSLTSSDKIEDIEAKMYNLFDSTLSKTHTHIFELTSPRTTVVIKYPETAVYYIGCRETETGKEISSPRLSESFPCKYPRKYPLRTVEQCIEAASYMNNVGDVTEEGFVVVDKYFHRVKIKSPKYLEMHHMVTTNPSDYRILMMILAGEMEETLAYFPHLKEKFQTISHKISRLMLDLTIISMKIKAREFPSRKELVAYLQEKYEKRFFEPLLKMVIYDSDPMQWLQQLSRDKKKEYFINDYRRPDYVD